MTSPFPSAAGWGNLSRGNFSPVVYSTKVIEFFKVVSTVEEITNTEFEGEIVEKGNRVRVLRQFETEAQPYSRGANNPLQYIDDEDSFLDVDQALEYKIPLDDIERRQSHIGWANQIVESGAYALRNGMDKEVIEYMRDNGTTVASTGTSGSEVTVNFNPGANFTPLNLLNRLRRFMDDNLCPDEGRYVLAKPVFYEIIHAEDSKYIEANTMGDPESALRRAKIGATPIHGFMCYKSVNTPQNANSEDIVIAGHKSAVCTAKQIVNSEVLRSESFQGDILRALLVYGRELFRPEALFVANVDFQL